MIETCRMVWTSGYAAAVAMPLTGSVTEAAASPDQMDANLEKIANP